MVSRSPSLALVLLFKAGQGDTRMGTQIINEIPATETYDLPLLAENQSEATVWRSDPDVVLMEQVRDGDVEAFEALFRRSTAPRS